MSTPATVMPITIWCRPITLNPSAMHRQYEALPPIIDSSAPHFPARFQNRPHASTQKNAVSRPPNANMLIFQMTSGGTMASTNTIAPMQSVTAWLERAIVRSVGFLPDDSQ